MFGGQSTESGRVEVTVEIAVDRLVRNAFLIALAFVPLNLALGYMRFRDVDESSPLMGVLGYLDLGAELALPAWYTAALLALSGVAAWAAAQRFDDDPVLRRGFRILTVIMAYLSLDEATKLHEKATDPLREALDLGGILYWSWVVPAMVAVGVVGLVLWRFLNELPRDISVPSFIAGVIYVTCALGLELIEGYYFEAVGPGVVTDLLSMVEEIGEIVAVLLFLRTMILAAAGGADLLAGNRFPSLRPHRPASVRT